MKKLLVLTMTIMSFVSCTKDDVGPEKVRIGAICGDGTKSNATGSGACSGHGGVKEWIYGIPSTPTNNLGRNY